MVELHDDCQPAVFFIDVQLDGYDMDGFDLARRLKWMNMKIWHTSMKWSRECLFRD